uniref:50S ribosomal protein L9 n=1 Tax=Pararhizobium sp. IMCC3301 TaxID=3067904 RepID=UPI0027422509|nr:50S ribosomal protein L9 [Pararhizobium sp. IMCC3301]
MNIILLERIARLGQVGDVVRVKDGYARNFLLPNGKALRATAANKKEFENRRTEIEARNLEMQSEAQQVATKLDGQSVIMIRRAGQTGQLYGSVNTRDIAAGLEGAGFHVLRSQIQLNEPIKKIGLHDITVALFADVNAAVSVNVARSEDEAERQAMGEDVSVAGDTFDEEEIVEEDAPDMEEVFEEGAGETANEDDADADADADPEDEDTTA